MRLMVPLPKVYPGRETYTTVVHPRDTLVGRHIPLLYTLWYPP